MILPFGKYRGCDTDEIIRLDPSYLYWLIEQEFLSEKFPFLYDHLLTVLGIRQESIELSGSVKAIIVRVCEALTCRGFTEGEARQMVDRLICHGKK